MLPANQSFIFRHAVLISAVIMAPDKAGSHDALQFSKSECDLKEKPGKTSK